MSQQPTPTGNPCLHASFQKENRTLAAMASAQKKRARVPLCAVLCPIRPPSLAVQISSSQPSGLHRRRAAHTTVHSAPCQAAVDHAFACLSHYCTIIVSTSETCPSHLYRARRFSNLGTQQVKRDTCPEVGGRASDGRVHLTSCRPAGLHRATRHTKASQRPVTPVRTCSECCSRIYTCKACNKVRRLMPCSLLQPTGLRQNVDSSTGNRTVNRSKVNIGRNSRLFAVLGCCTRCCTARRGPKRESDARARPRSHKSLPSFWEKRRLLAWPPWLASSPIERCLRKPFSGVLAIIHE